MAAKLSAGGNLLSTVDDTNSWQQAVQISLSSITVPSANDHQPGPESVCVCLRLSLLKRWNLSQ